MKLKKTANVLTAIMIIGIAVFVLGVIFADTDGARRRIFSVAMPVAGVSFCGAILLSVIDSMNHKK